MSWNDPNELVIASNGQIYVAPVGTTLPAIDSDPTAALDAAFVGLGLATEDGVTLTITPDVKEFKAWQSRNAVRTVVNAREVQAAFALEQFNEETIPFAFGGGAVSNAGGFYTFSLPAAGDALDERAMVIDAQDGDRNMRIVIPRGNVTDAVETKFQAADLAILPITFKALEPLAGGAAMYVIFDDAAAFAAGS
jgi:hypothetical protein